MEKEANSKVVLILGDIHDPEYTDTINKETLRLTQVGYTVISMCPDVYADADDAPDELQLLRDRQMRKLANMADIIYLLSGDGQETLDHRSRFHAVFEEIVGCKPVYFRDKPMSDVLLKFYEKVWDASNRRVTTVTVLGCMEDKADKENLFGLLWFMGIKAIATDEHSDPAYNNAWLTKQIGSTNGCELVQVLQSFGYKDIENSNAVLVVGEDKDHSLEKYIDFAKNKGIPVFYFKYRGISRSIAELREELLFNAEFIETLSDF